MNNNQTGPHAAMSIADEPTVTPYTPASAAEATKVAGDPIRVYLDLANRWDATTREIDGLVSQLTRGAERLRGTAWRKARLGAYEFPPESAQQTIAPWPAADDLGRKMAGWHALKTELNTAWELIPSEDRRQLKDPPA